MIVQAVVTIIEEPSNNEVSCIDWTTSNPNTTPQVVPSGTKNTVIQKIRTPLWSWWHAGHPRNRNWSNGSKIIKNKSAWDEIIEEYSCALQNKPTTAATTKPDATKTCHAFFTVRLLVSNHIISGSLHSSPSHSPSNCSSRLSPYQNKSSTIKNDSIFQHFAVSSGKRIWKLSDDQVGPTRDFSFPV